jgi:hypothetical protein
VTRRLSSAAAVGGLLLVSYQPSAAEDVPAPLVACAAEPDDGQRLACFDETLARLRGGGEAAPSAAAPVAAPAPAVAAAAAAPAPTEATASQRSVPPEEAFGLRGELKDEKLGNLDELVSTVTNVRAKPHGELVVTLANEQVWAEIASGSKIKLKPGDTVKIESGSFRSFILVAPNGRSSKVTRVR